MHVDRLLELARFLDEEVQEDKFDLGHWGVIKGLELEGLSDKDLKPDCGTTACAVGWACFNPALPELTAGIDTNYYMVDMTSVVLMVPVYKDYEGWEAVEEYFDINSDQSEYLFDDYNYPDDKSLNAVVERIRDFVKGE